MHLPLFIGLRYTGARRRNQLVSFISAISIAGMVISVALLVVVLSIMNGFDKELRERILNVMPQGAIYHRYGIADWEEARETVLSTPGVAEAAPFVQLTGMATYKRNVSAVMLYGVDPAYQNRVSDLEQFLPAPLASLFDRAEDPPIILGSELAKKMEAQTGKLIRVLIPHGDEGNNTRTLPAIKGFRVVGIVNTGTEADQNLALTSIAETQSLTGYQNMVTGLWLKLDDVFAAPSVVYEAVLKLPRGYSSTDWTRSQGNVYQAIQMSKQLVGLLLILIIGIAAFNVVSTLIMVTVDKQGDIAILRTLGASTQKIMAIFMVQGTLIGVIGTGLGLALGVLMAGFVQEFVAWLESVIGFQFLKSDVYPISFVPADIRQSDLIAIVVTAMLLSFLATLYPAWRASRVKPADALRYEV